MLKVGLATELLPIGVLNPGPDEFLIGAGKGVREVEQAGYQAGSIAGRPVFDGKNADQRVSKIDQSIKSASFTSGCFRLIRSTSGC